MSSSETYQTMYYNGSCLLLFEKRALLYFEILQRQVYDSCNIQDGALCDNSQPLTIITKRSILDVAAAGDALLLKILN